MKRKKGHYSISVVAKMFDVHQQTIRLYEKEGLINPERTAGGTRMFSEEDVDRLEEIIYLTHKIGVNIAGVEMVLKLQRKIKKMQDDMNKLFEQAHVQLDDEKESLKETAKEQVRILKSFKKLPAPSPDEPTEEITISDDWEVEYDKEDSVTEQ